MGLTPEQRQSDDLAWLGELAKTPEGNIIKLPNISASVPQLTACIAELQSKGYKVPDYNPNPVTDQEKENKVRYGKVLGSAVNPVLREGNSDRRCARPVKEMAMSQEKRSPGMKPWVKENRTLVAHMTQGDFFEKEINDCKDKSLMLSLHLKATMMKVSDPIMFGHMVKVFFKSVFEKHGKLFDELKVNPNNGLGDVYDKIKGHPAAAEVEADLAACYVTRPGLAMVDSSKGITNLHVPSDVIIDASMPCVVRDGGAMWNKDDKLEEVKCIIPDRSYSTMYAAILDDCRENGQFDWKSMGHTSNVGLMAKKAEEYGSHDKTFEIQTNGEVSVKSCSSGKEIFKHQVCPGDIWRMCQTKDSPIRDWVKLAVNRARATKARTVFWLHPKRAHDR